MVVTLKARVCTVEVTDPREYRRRKNTGSQEALVRVFGFDAMNLRALLIAAVARHCDVNLI